MHLTVSKLYKMQINCCVCYLPPEGSCRNEDSHAFFDTLISQIYLYQNDGLFIICGDVNSRYGQSIDFIEGVDVVPERHVNDFNENTYGAILMTFY